MRTVEGLDSVSARSTASTPAIESDQTGSLGFAFSPRERASTAKWSRPYRSGTSTGFTHAYPRTAWRTLSPSAD